MNKEILRINAIQISNLESEAKSGPPYITEKEEEELYDAIDKCWEVRKLLSSSEESTFLIPVSESNKVIICVLHNTADSVSLEEYNGIYNDDLSDEEIAKIIQEGKCETMKDPYNILNKLEKIVGFVVPVSELPHPVKECVFATENL